MDKEVFWITGPWPGRLAIALRPRGGDWLSDEIRSWRDMGLNVVVSLLTPNEILELELDQEMRWCQEYGIQFYSFLPDREVPESWKAVAALIKDLDLALKVGKNIAVHCRQGIGRSSLISASLLIAGGANPESAWEHISQSRARGRAVPDTEEQYAWVKSFESIVLHEMRTR